MAFLTASVTRSTCCSIMPGQIGRLIARLDDEEQFFPPLSFGEAMRAAVTGDGPRIGVREHVLAVAAELEA